MCLQYRFGREEGKGKEGEGEGEGRGGKGEDLSDENNKTNQIISYFLTLTSAVYSAVT